MTLAFSFSLYTYCTQLIEFVWIIQRGNNGYRSNSSFSGNFSYCTRHIKPMWVRLFTVFQITYFFIRILFIFIEPLPHMFIICKCIFQMHTLWYFIIIQNDIYTKDFVLKTILQKICSSTGKFGFTHRIFPQRYISAAKNPKSLKLNKP